MSPAPNQAIRGRGSAANIRNRFESLDYLPDDEFEDDEPARNPTLYMRDESKSILTRNDSPDVGFDLGINPYRGCEHGCAYCYARPTHEYLGFSPGLEFETRIMVKENAPELLERELRSRKYAPQTIALSGVTDCYQPIERKLEITRRCLQVLNEFKNPVAIITKNRLVTRDIDILKEMAAYNGAMVLISVTTLDLKLNRVLEPRTSSPSQRLDTIRQLSEAGVPVGTLVAPVIPGLNDHEIPSILESVAKAGAIYAGYIMLRLPFAVAPLFQTWLDRHYPDRKDKVMNRIRSVRDGKDYKSAYGVRMRGTGLWADQIESVFQVNARRYGLYKHGFALSVESFSRPERAGDQMGLFA